ncbi:MAG: sigma-70 family RNA polymerase sigma factor [Gemmataceae bacterium]|nr:sigma-70 family RNA polymerase sigma factor [Gemmataceae bacterium]
MTDPFLSTAQLHDWLARIRCGDPAARAELLHRVGSRLERLVRPMLRSFPGGARWDQADAVLQNSLLRLLRALEEVRPASVREFFSLAATQMRRELFDLARHYQGPQDLGTQHETWPVATDCHAGSRGPARDVADSSHDTDGLERWIAFHHAVEELPAEEREVVSLLLYHGWTQTEIAALFQVSVRTVIRRWQSACLQLHALLGGRFPQA